ncbi:MAG: DUF362 domain-containing protein [Bacillota bacterium]|nr:DUF362 domain-containing protein [Bacillota bacterium]MDD3298600.1 DUF362 domain-containing protein [Bacillota bacterium]MDD3850947.1 DUF362 domain-containing protein [Bacillota bacterium]MDD4708048.1 DUF362 domain-containing protein [Bacillota bacterium]
MSKVWFSTLEDNTSPDIISQKVVGLYYAAGFEKVFDKDEFAAVKIHFGEKNNTGHINPQWIKPLLDTVKQKRCKPFLTDTNTLYRGQRQNSINHLMQAYQHGFCIENLGVPIIIADGLLSKNYSEVPVDGKHLKSVKIANDILHSHSLMVLSHVTGHVLTGMGAAIKNVAMGCAPRSGKQIQHADVRPEVKKEKCRACGLCIEWCPRDAIQIYDGAARIDIEKCYGCGECIATCRHQAIKYSFKDTSVPLQEKMAEYALGALKGKKGKCCFFNFLTHITKECDCADKAQSKITKDIGILASYDPVAIDKATTDLLIGKSGKDILRNLWPENDYNVQIKHAEELGLGSGSYELVKVD